MDSLRCYLCDHEFVEGEEPWLMFEQRLSEDGLIECSLADLLGTILQKDLQEAIAHSTLLCDSCNADIMEYESLQKRFLQIRERILSSYKDNVTVQNLHDLIQQATNSLPNENLSVCSNDEANRFLMDNSNDMESSEFANYTEMDLVEEVPDDDEAEVQHDGNNKDLSGEQDNHDPTDHRSFVANVNSAMISDNLDFAAFNEHVAQTSLPTSVLNLSDSLINLEVNEKISLESQDIIIYDGCPDKLKQAEPIFRQENEKNDLKNYDNTEDDDFIITNNIFTSDGNCEDSQESVTSESIVTHNNEPNTITQTATTAAPKPVCKKEGDVFVCLRCELSEKYERLTLIKHLQTFHNSKFYMCDHCNEGYGRRQDLKTHSEIGHIIRCENCEQTFNNTRLYRIHKRTHYNYSKPYECLVCQKTYVSKSGLDEHMNTHTGVRPFKCPECAKDFASKCTLQTHMKIHQYRPRPYQCDQCEKRFLNQQNLNQHKKLHVSVKAFQCDVCKKAFTTQHSLQVHKIVHSGQRPFICRICGKSFARRPEIKDHERIHTGERPFKCEYCPMAFAQRTNLASHKKSTHLNEKSHKCDICLRSFKRKRLLDYHIKAVHTGERPHKCEICGAGFVYPEHYKKHMLIHSGRKPYACEVCGKQFNSRDNRNAHRFVHSDKKPYECMECGAGFMRKPLLLAHMKQTKHINDTIIINQPQFTHQQLQENDNATSVDNTDDYNGTIEECEIYVDNDLKSQDFSEESLEEIISKAEELLVRGVPVSSITDTNIEDEDNAMATVNDNLIKSDLDDAKYLPFEDIDPDGHQSITWVDIGGDVKV